MTSRAGSRSQPRREQGLCWEGGAAGDAAPPTSPGGRPSPRQASRHPHRTQGWELPSRGKLGDPAPGGGAWTRQDEGHGVRWTDGSRGGGRTQLEGGRGTEGHGRVWSELNSGRSAKGFKRASSALRVLSAELCPAPFCGDGGGGGGRREARAGLWAGRGLGLGPSGQLGGQGRFAGARPAPPAVPGTWEDLLRVFLIKTMPRVCGKGPFHGEP